MIKRILFGVIALAVLAVAAGTAVVAAAYALFALLEPSLGPAGAAACVAGAAMLLLGLVGFVAGMQARGGRPSPKAEPSLIDRITDIARERPMLAAGAALAAGIVALKNPKLAAGLASAFMAGKAADKAETSRRRW